MRQKGLFIYILLLLLSCVGSCNALMQDKAGFDFFDQIYTINLERSVARRQHVIQEFARMNIHNYKIFVATDMDSPEVAFLMRSNFVKQYPPCFRCHKIFCKCNNNVLIKQQIGNWLSFINIFKDVIKNNYEFVLITEDDVKFLDNAPQILSQLINLKSFAANNIDRQRPVLIRLEKRGITTPRVNTGFTKDIIMSNACFIINRLYAESFLNHITQIDHTSDYYIHSKMLELDPSIQHFTAYPQLAYQLSENANATFYSEIHPKGIDAYDQKRKQKHKGRITYGEYLINCWRKYFAKL